MPPPSLASAFFFGRPSAIIAGTETVKSPAAKPRQVRAKSSILNLNQNIWRGRILLIQVLMTFMKNDRIIAKDYINVYDYEHMQQII